MKSVRMSLRLVKFHPVNKVVPFVGAPRDVRGAGLGCFTGHELYAECVRGRKRPKAVGPFHEADRFGEGIGEAKLDKFRRVAEAIKIGVPNLALGGVVGLNQRKCGGWDIFGRVEQRLNEAAAEMGLARTDFTAKEDRIARAQMAPDCMSEGASCGGTLKVNIMRRTDHGRRLHAAPVASTARSVSGGFGGRILINVGHDQKAGAVGQAQEPCRKWTGRGGIGLVEDMPLTVARPAHLPQV